MATVDDVLVVQKQENVLYAPEVPSTQTVFLKTAATMGTMSAATTPTTLTITLYNSGTTYMNAYITGLAINNNNAVCLIEADGKTPYYPASPSAVGTALAVDCCIPVGAAGATKTVTIPYIAGGRIWFTQNSSKLTFLLNPGPGLVEPSISNPSDPNYNLVWDFCEFTYNSAQIYANITYVDFVSIPISLTLTNSSGTTQHIAGLPAGGLATVAAGMVAQNTKDGAGWDKLVIKNGTTTLRVVSPTNGIILNSGLFSSYWTAFINSVWAKYQTTGLVIDTQVSWGTLTGTSDGTNINFSGVGSFAKPSAVDIFGANSGPFAASNTEEMKNLGARINAAINRSTILTNAVQPDNEVTSSFYTNAVTNHYARVVHATNLDGKGYCHPYDDVGNSNVNCSGFVADGAPTTFLISVGGTGAYTRRRQVNMEYRERARMGRRDIGWLEDIKSPEAMSDVHLNQDLERGEMKMGNEGSMFLADEAVRRFKLPPAVERVVGPYLEKLQSSTFYTQYLMPFLVLLHQFIISALSLSIRTIISRAFIVLCFFLFYFMGLLPHTKEVVGGAVEGRVLESLAGNVTMVVQGGN